VHEEGAVPHTDTQGRSGAANFAPITPATPNPIGPKPIEPISESGRFGLQNPSSQLWCTPMSLTRIASSGSALSISSAARCGLIGWCHRKNRGQRICPIPGDRYRSAPAISAGVGLPGEIGAAIEFGMQLPQEGAHVRHQAECYRIVAADFLGIDVDVNQSRRRNGEGVRESTNSRCGRRTASPSPATRRPAGWAWLA